MNREAHLFHNELHLMADELNDRYHTLRERVRTEVVDLETHGHHVGDLERSVRPWLDSVDEAHVFSTETSAKPGEKEQKNV